MSESKPEEDALKGSINYMINGGAKLALVFRTLI